MAGPAYFETPPSVQSTMCFFEALTACLVASVVGWSRLSALPIVVSVAGVIANACVYVMYYRKGSRSSILAASAPGDIAFMIQEAGLSFYSLFILLRILRKRTKAIFLSLFSITMGCAIICRVWIVYQRIMMFKVMGLDQALYDRRYTVLSFLHVGFFSSLALCEMVSAYFLLRVFFEARSTAKMASLHSSLMTQLIQNTEIRVATLAIVGIARVITQAILTRHIEQVLAGEFDRFVYTFECFFPTILMIDLLISRIAKSNAASMRRSEAGGQSGTARRYQLSNMDKADRTIIREQTVLVTEQLA